MEQYKIAIVSDTHGNWKKALEEMRKETGITHFVFLGDHAKDGEAEGAGWDGFPRDCTYRKKEPQARAIQRIMAIIDMRFFMATILHKSRI